MAAYIPPHKRQLKDGASTLSPTPPSELGITRFRKNLKVTSKNCPKKILYAENAIIKWFVVGLADDSRLSDFTRLEPVAVESCERDSGKKPLVLVLKENGKEAPSKFSKDPWDFVAVTVKQDLFSSFQQVKDEMRGFDFVEIKPTLVLRFGRILFHGNHSFTAESMIASSPPAGTLKQMRKSFYTNVPPSYVEYIINDVVPQFDFKFEKRELYHVKLSDKMRPDSTISCKCTVAKDTNQLELVKIELNQVRNLVADMSCPDKNLDLRLMLCMKRILVALTDEELGNIKSLIDSARLDSEVKGGLTWPLGKQSAGDRYTGWSLAYNF